MIFILIFSWFSENLDIAFSSTTPGISGDTYVARGEFQDTTIVDQGNGWHKVVTSCPLYFPGISFEEDKGWILMETDVRTENYQDNIGTNVVTRDLNSFWILVRSNQGVTDLLDYRIEFDYLPVLSVEPTGACKLFLSEADAMHGVQSYFGGTTATATTDSLFQISGVPATVTTDRTGDVPATVTADIMFYPGIILAPITTSSSSAKLESTSDTFLWTQSAQILPGIRRRGIREFTAMRNKLANATAYFIQRGVNLLQCGRTCYRNPDCWSVFYLSSEGECHVHKTIYESGERLNGTMYFIIDFEL